MAPLHRLAAPALAAAFAGALALAAAQQRPLHAPATSSIRTALEPSFAWWEPDDGKVFSREVDYFNDTGMVRTLLKDGPMETSGHPFFSALGPNGRGCITCHQPADAMSLSAATAAARWDDTNGQDPLFAAVDGSNCPTLPQADRTSHSLLLDHGLIRIERDWPPKDAAGRVLKPDFKLEVVRDAHGCNSGQWGPRGKLKKISVYRRPRPVTNLKFLATAGFAPGARDGPGLESDPARRKPSGSHLMADARVFSLEEQARDAMTSHLGLSEFDEAKVRQIVDFELRLSTAQQIDARGGRVDTHGAEGGPLTLETSQPGEPGSIARAVGSEFEAWENIPADAKLSNSERAFRESVARGARIFSERTFLITGTAGAGSPIGSGNPVRNSCVFCHNMRQMGTDAAPVQADLGTTNQPFADPAPHLPLFRVTCTGEPHPHYGKVILTHDPGFALTTGRCADVGKITLQSMRGLAARAPYFSNGSAKTLRDIVEFYERRYGIGYSEQDKQDLVNLMSVL